MLFLKVFVFVVGSLGQKLIQIAMSFTSPIAKVDKL